jgi:hypothetical protein
MFISSTNKKIPRLFNRVANIINKCTKQYGTKERSLMITRKQFKMRGIKVMDSESKIRTGYVTTPTDVSIRERGGFELM